VGACRCAQEAIPVRMFAREVSGSTGLARKLAAVRTAVDPGVSMLPRSPAPQPWRIMFVSANGVVHFDMREAPGRKMVG